MESGGGRDCTDLERFKLICELLVPRFHLRHCGCTISFKLCFQTTHALVQGVNVRLQRGPTILQQAL